MYYYWYAASYLAQAIANPIHMHGTYNLTHMVNVAMYHSTLTMTIETQAAIGYQCVDDTKSWYMWVFVKRGRDLHTSIASSSICHDLVQSN